MPITSAQAARSTPLSVGEGMGLPRLQFAKRAKKQKALTTYGALARLFRNSQRGNPRYEREEEGKIRTSIPREHTAKAVGFLHKLFKEQGGRCEECNRPLALESGESDPDRAIHVPVDVPVKASLDHIEPKRLATRGEKDPEHIFRLENMRFTCPVCNRSKNGHLLGAFTEHLRRTAAFRDFKLKNAEPENAVSLANRLYYSRKGRRLLKYAHSIFAFGNQEEGLSFDQALHHMRASNQKAFKDIVKKASEKLGIRPKLEDGIGDTAEWGAEPSVLQRIHEPIDEHTARYLGAWYGLLANQKSVLVFHPGHGGPDSTYELDVPDTDLARVREQLNASGVPFRTLIPTSKGTRVVVFDKGRELRDNLAKFGERYNAEIRESTGRGEFIGGSPGSFGANSRTEARANYRRLITAYESRKGSQAPAPVQVSEPAQHSHNSPSGSSAVGPVKFSKGHVPPAQDPNFDVSIPRDTYKPQLPSLPRLGFREFVDSIKQAWKRHGKKAKPPVVKEERLQAPSGGAIVRGIYYPGGETMPSKDYSDSQREKYAKGDVAGALKEEADHKARLRYAAGDFEAPELPKLPKSSSGPGMVGSGINPPSRKPSAKEAGDQQSRLQFLDPYRQNAGSPVARRWGEINAQARKQRGQEEEQAAQQRQAGFKQVREQYRQNLLNQQRGAVGLPPLSQGAPALSQAQIPQAPKMPTPGKPQAHSRNQVTWNDTPPAPQGPPMLKQEPVPPHPMAPESLYPPGTSKGTSPWELPPAITDRQGRPLPKAGKKGPIDTKARKPGTLPYNPLRSVLPSMFPGD